ncbi:MAG: WYL domain-containing protein, partial [Candidatus Saccharibacteria bacterium]|nr:WYL domain-containing protein [Candidatus Saccharibacteria bacterium]
MTGSIKIKVAVPTTIRNQLELDISDYNLKGIGDLCNYIIEHREHLPKSSENKGFKKECNELFKNCQPLQFTLHKSNIQFADFANGKGAKLASICR